MLTKGRPYPNLPLEKQLELISRVQESNCEESWEILLDQYSPIITKRTFQLCLQPWDDPDLIESELILRFFQAVKSFNPTCSKPSTYIFWALHRPVHIRRLIGPIKVSKLAWKRTPELYEAATTNISPLSKEIVAPSEPNNEIYDLISSLPERPRRVLGLRLEGYSLREIAEELGEDPEKFRNGYRYLLKKVREQCKHLV